MKNIALVTFIFLCIYGCSRNSPCSDPYVHMVFTKFTPFDLDTIVLRKYKPGDNYEHLLDTLEITFDSGKYVTSNDTTVIFLDALNKGIMARYDWQIAIPALSRIVAISGIVTEQNSIKCSTVGEPLGCFCQNKIYSLKMDNTFIDLSAINQNQDYYKIYIHK
jgi:hypothetical protein